MECINREDFKFSFYSFYQSRKPITLVDVPGNERVRERYFSNYKDSLRLIAVAMIHCIPNLSQLTDCTQWCPKPNRLYSFNLPYKVVYST